MDHLSEEILAEMEERASAVVQLTYSDNVQLSYGHWLLLNSIATNTRLLIVHVRELQASSKAGA